MTRCLLGLFAGRPGARAYRQRLSMLATRPGAGLATLSEAVAAVRRAPLAACGMSAAPHFPFSTSRPRSTE